MFTGIVQAIGSVVDITPTDSGIRLVIDRTNWDTSSCQPALGHSICVSGVCLTVTQFDRRTLTFDVIAETLAKTTLGQLKPGHHVNLEPAVTPSTPLGGHFVQGHIDGIGHIADLQTDEEDWRLTIQPTPVSQPTEQPNNLMDWIIPKGSITVDGVSLTIAAVGEVGGVGETGESKAAGGQECFSPVRFQVALIPTTRQLTTLGHVKPGDPVNLEADIISKTVVHHLTRLAPTASNITTQTLQNAGFIDQPEKG